MKNVIIVPLFFFIVSFCFSQTIQENYLLQDVGYISIPSNMEIQSGEYKKYVDGFHEKYGKLFGYEIYDNRVVFQQKGLNNLDEKGFITYARVSLETNIGHHGDFTKLETPLVATQTELSEISSSSKLQLQQSFSGSSLRLIKWYGVSIVNVNGNTAVKMSYLRQAADRPFVVVDLYSFQNNDRIHLLTLSYRQSDELLWKPLFDVVLDSFTITNIR